MIKKPKDIKKAIEYLDQGEYSKAIRLLESKIPLYVENKEFYVILAKAFFYTGDYSGAKLYFDRGQKIQWDIDSALFTAVLSLKRRDFNSALRIWLDILDENPENKMAKSGLEALKKYSTMEELDYFLLSNKINKLLPKKKFYLRRPTIIVLIIVFILLTSIFVSIKYNLVDKVFDSISNTSSKNYNREGIQDFNLKDLNNNFLDYSKLSTYNFTGAQIEEFFNVASDLFVDDKDNRVRTYLNLIKYSNSNELVKKRAEVLESYLVDPDWSNYSDDISFTEVINSRYQYESCIVKWKGMISNLEIKDKKIKFSLLVGYDDGKVLEGVVPVELNENIKIQENLPIEVLGKVILNNDTFYLDAKSIMQYIVRK
ncbi:MAG: hypothetical protein JXR64_04535 [Spirochaetales bacterium]|nr:hypothetical protein [Spirochaetales bacterium]